MHAVSSHSTAMPRKPKFLPGVEEIATARIGNDCCEKCNNPLAVQVAIEFRDFLRAISTGPVDAIALTAQCRHCKHIRAVTVDELVAR